MKIILSVCLLWLIPVKLIIMSFCCVALLSLFSGGIQYYCRALPQQGRPVSCSTWPKPLDTNVCGSTTMSIPTYKNMLACILQIAMESWCSRKVNAAFFFASNSTLRGIYSVWYPTHAVFCVYVTGSVKTDHLVKAVH